MKGLIPLICSVACVLSIPGETFYDRTSELPVINPTSESFKKIVDVAQYGLGDWSEVVGIAKGVSRREAVQIANDNPEITFFFYTKGIQMVLGNEEIGWRVFHHGDAVFFKGDPWWGSAYDLADGYIRQ